jgi:3D (Asp-Asp-Asp) domain-containing protein
MQVIHSAAPSLGEALWEGGVVLREGDILTPAPETTVHSSIRASLIRSRSLVINVDGIEIETRAVGPTVGDGLSQSGIALVGLDYSQPAVDMPLPENGQIHVVRVQEQIQVELEPMPFDTVYQPAADLELDNLQIIDPGNYGVLATRIRVRFEEGQEVNRSIEETWVAVDAEPRVLGYGTRIEIRALDTPDGRIEYWRAVPVYATSYSPCNLGVAGCNSTTASGKELRRGMIGVIRSWYNMMRGWSVYIPGYGFATIEDIGAGIAGRHWIDLGFTDDEYERWHTWTTLYFIPPVPSANLIPWILP